MSRSELVNALEHLVRLYQFALDTRYKQSQLLSDTLKVDEKLLARAEGRKPYF